MSVNKEQLWDKCASFHGHMCGGSAIGFCVALYAMQLLEIDFSHDEEVVCVTENDACGVDAIQVVLGCSVGKGNLLFHITGKQAWSFYNRKTGKSVRLVLNPQEKRSKEESISYFLNTPLENLFTVKPVVFQLPERARLFDSVPCSVCGEMTAEPYLRLEQGKLICVDCYHPYHRFT